MPWLGGTSPGFPPAVRKMILERDPICRCDGCPRCHTPQRELWGTNTVRLVHTNCAQPSTEADHIRQGGGDDPSNGRGLCSACHKWRTSQQAAAARAAKLKARRPPEPHPGLR